MTIRLATPGDGPAAARVLAAAFRDDPVLRLGFRVESEVRLLGSPPLWPMVRSPGVA